jgi:hypothetical protein
MRKLFVLCVAALATGCGQASDETINQEFDTNFRASCVSSAVRSGAPEALATQVCDCTLEGINAKFSASEKLTMSPQQAQPMMAACMEKAVQQ